RSKAQEEKLEDHSALYWRQRLLPSLLPDVFCPLLGEELRCMHRHHARSTRGRRSVAPASQLHRVPVLPRVPAIAQAVVGNGDFGDAHQLLDALPASTRTSPYSSPSPLQASAIQRPGHHHTPALPPTSPLSADPSCSFFCLLCLLMWFHFISIFSP
ncbi:hypothetical protein SORBI_3005G091400, partial [Sorghum bicolor]